MLACGHVSGTESTALKRRSNGAAEMKADRVERACLSRSVGFILLFSTLRPGTMSLGRGDESVAPVFLEASANNGDSCAGGDPVSKASPGCAQYAAAGCCTIHCRLPKLRPIHDQRGTSRSQPLRQASGRQRPMATAGRGLRGQDIQVLLDRKIEPVSDAVLWLLRPLVPRSSCLAVCCRTRCW